MLFLGIPKGCLPHALFLQHLSCSAMLCLKFKILDTPKNLAPPTLLLKNRSSLLVGMVSPRDTTSPTNVHRTGTRGQVP